MKKILITLIVMLTSFIGVNAESFYDSEITVDTIMVDIPASIKMYDGDIFDVKIKIDEEYKYIEKYLEIEQIDNCFYIKLNGVNNYDYELFDNEKIKIYVMTPNNLKIMTKNRNLIVSSNPNIQMKKHENTNN